MCWSFFWKLSSLTTCLIFFLTTITITKDVKQLSQQVLQSKQYASKHSKYNSHSVHHVNPSDSLLNQLKNTSTKIGRVGQINYLGRWTSPKESQFNFLHRNGGLSLISLNTPSENILEIDFHFFDGQYLNNDDLCLSLFWNVKDPSIISIKESLMVFTSHHFSVETKLCDLIISTEFVNKFDGSYISIESDDISQVAINGSLRSSECGIELIFVADPYTYSDSTMILWFVLWTCVHLVSVIPYYRFDSKLNLFTSVNFMSVIMIFLYEVSFALTLTARTKVSSRLFVEFFGLFVLILSVCKLIYFYRNTELGFLFAKIRNQTNLIKCVFILLSNLVVLGCYFLFAIANVYFIFILNILFFYPVIQIYSNCISKNRETCFIWWVHPVIFLHPLLITTYYNAYPNMFRIQPHYISIVCLWLQTILLLVIMFCQKKYGRMCLIPKQLRPGYFDYYCRFADHPEVKGDSCSFCKCRLDLDSEYQDDTVEESLVLREKFIKTQCEHVYHVTCFKEVFDESAKCTICNQKLAPFYD